MKLARLEEFDYRTRVVFGPGAVDELGSLARQWGRSVLVVTGSSLSRWREQLDALERITGRLAVHSQKGEPVLADIESARALARANRCGWVLGLGGGSALDVAKSVAALANSSTRVIEHVEVVGEGRPLPRDPLPCVCVPTTAGTGSEVTRNAVVRVPAHGVKVSLRGSSLFPRVALVDPRLALALPKGPTAASGLDAAVQLLEAFLSPRCGWMTEALCRDGLVRVGRALPEALHRPDSLEARADLAAAATASGLALTAAGLGDVHAVAGVLGGRRAVAHGHACARLVAPILHAYLVRGTEELRSRIALAASLLVQDGGGDVHAISRWVEGCCTAGGLGPVGVGIDAQERHSIAQQALLANSHRTSPVELTATELADALAVA